VADIIRIEPDTSWYARWESRFGRYWAALVLAVVIQVGSFLLYPFHPHTNLDRYVRYKTLVTLSENPLTSQPLFEPTVRHRILVPVMAWTLGLKGAWYIVLIFVGDLLFLYLIIILMREFVPPRIAALTTILIGTTLALITSQSWLIVQDTWANAAVVACLVFRRHVWSIGPILFLGMLADERCLATLPLMFLAFHLDDSPERRRYLRSRRLLFVLLACAVYAPLCYWLHQHTAAKFQGYYGYAKQEDFVVNMLRGEVLLRQLPYVPAGRWYALRAAWLLPLLLLWHKRRERAFTLWFLVGLGAATGQAVLVEDISRMASLAFPAVLLAVVLLYQSRPALTTLLLGFAIAANVLAPQFQINLDRLSLMTPLPFEWLRPEPWSKKDTKSS
jgi:hypothetical protein